MIDKADVELGIAGYQDGSFLCHAPISDRLALLHRTKKSWSEMNFRKRETRTIETSFTTCTLQSSVLMIGTALDGSLVDAISGHILTSELAGTGSYCWEVEHPPAKVRDFTIDPYQDLLILMEENTNE